LQQDRIAENILERMKDVENYPEEHLAPYKEFEIGTNPTTSPPVGSSIGRILDRKRWEASSAATFPTTFGTTGPTTPNKSFTRGQLIRTQRE